MESSQKIYIMWCGSKSKNLWVPNHFIAHFQIQNSAPTINISPPLSPVCLSSPSNSHFDAVSISPQQSQGNFSLSISSNISNKTD